MGLLKKSFIMHVKYNCYWDVLAQWWKQGKETKFHQNMRYAEAVVISAIWFLQGTLRRGGKSRNKKPKHGKGPWLCHQRKEVGWHHHSTQINHPINPLLLSCTFTWFLHTSIHWLDESSTSTRDVFNFHPQIYHMYSRFHHANHNTPCCLLLQM